jgi:AmmeMemoRadiSam system protein B/AmmeMemoRadiSam system protein A
LKLDETALAGAARHMVHGAFVSLKRKGRLRGCCGFVGREATLAEALIHAAGRTANDDHRFPPVSPSELEYLDVEVWLLDRPQPVALRGEERRSAVVIGKHGLQIACGESHGLLLPGVAVEHGFDAEAFLQQVCLKAGLPPTAWKQDDATLMTFEGRSLCGSLAELLEPQPAEPTPRFSSTEIAALAEFCRTNILAAVQGATPCYYAFGVSDGNVHGVAVSVEAPDGSEWLNASRISLRQSMPLQATLYSLAESMGQALSRQRLDHVRLAGIQVGLTILYDAAMHGSASDPDLRGHDPRGRALVVMERSRSAMIFDPSASPEAALVLAVEKARLLIPAAASVFSLAATSNRPRMVLAQGTAAQAGPNVRPPAVAGRFYPADVAQLGELVDQCLAGETVAPEAWPAAMAPHAGLIYSGRLAADVLRRVKIPQTVIVIGPKHTPLGVDWAVAPHQTWSIPGATLPADPRLARQLVEAIPGLELDAAAHQQEHAIEVELPFLARLSPATKVVGIAIGAGDLQTCRRFADGLARVISTLPQQPLLVISSDMNHFAEDAENRRLDELALAAMERLDPELLLSTCQRHHISMCGVLPAVIVMETLRRLGGLTNTRRVGYATSADVSGDTRRVVGYAGMLLK